MDLVVSGELIDELGLPTIGGRIGTERAGVSGEGGGKDVAVVLQLAGVVGITSDVVSERTGVLGRRTWHHTVIQIELATIVQSVRKWREAETCKNSRHVEGNEELEVGTGILSSLIRVINLTRLPGVGSDVQGEGVDAVAVGKVDVLQPGVGGVRVRVAHHMVGSHNLGVAAVSLHSCRNEVASRSGNGRSGGANPTVALTCT